MIDEIKNWISYEFNGISREWNKSKFTKVKLLVNYFRVIAQFTVLVLGIFFLPYYINLFFEGLNSMLGFLISGFFIQELIIPLHEVFKNKTEKPSLKKHGDKIFLLILTGSFILFSVIKMLAVFSVAPYIGLGFTLIFSVLQVYNTETLNPYFQLTASSKIARALLHSTIILLFYLAVFTTILPLLPIFLPPAIVSLVIPVTVISLSIAKGVFSSIEAYNKQNKKEQLVKDLKIIESERLIVKDDSKTPAKPLSNNKVEQLTICNKVKTITEPLPQRQYSFTKINTIPPLKVNLPSSTSTSQDIVPKVSFVERVRMKWKKLAQVKFK